MAECSELIWLGSSFTSERDPLRSDCVSSGSIHHRRRYASQSTAVKQLSTLCRTALFYANALIDTKNAFLNFIKTHGGNVQKRTEKLYGNAQG